MTGHAVVMKDDGSVYIHLLPVGNYAVASQQTMVMRFENEVGPVDLKKCQRQQLLWTVVIMPELEAMPKDERNKVLMGNMTHEQFDPEQPEHSIISFPYSFPSPGCYRIWIQLKRNGKILNSAFDATVD